MITGSDDQGAYLDTGTSTLWTIRTSATAPMTVTSQAKDTGTSAVPATRTPTTKLPTAQR